MKTIYFSPEPSDPGGNSEPRARKASESEGTKKGGAKKGTTKTKKK